MIQMTGQGGQGRKTRKEELEGRQEKRSFR